MRYVRLPNTGQVLAACIVLWLNAGIYSYVQRVVPGVAMYCLFGVWIISALKKDTFRKEFTRIVLQTIPVFILLFFVQFCIHQSSLTKNYIMIMVYVVIIRSITLYYWNDSYAKRFLVFVWGIDVGFVVINTFVHIKMNPMIIRNMSANAAVFESLFGGKVYAVAAYSNILCYVVAVLFMFSRIVNKSIKSSWREVVAIGILTLLIFKSQIGLLIVLTIVGLLFIAISGFFRTDKSLICFGIVTLIVASILYRFLPSIFSFISSIEMLPDLLRIKAADAGIILSGSTADLKDASVRMQQYENDINSFLANPIFGTKGDNSTIGGHSTWIDLLGMYGLFALIVVNWQIMILKDIAEMVVKEERKIVVAILSVFTLLGLIDPIFFPNVYMTLVMVIPYMSYINRENNVRERIDESVGN